MKKYRKLEGRLALMQLRPIDRLISSRVQEYIAQAKAENTRKAYTQSWRHFVKWCEGHQVASLPATAETVATYLADLADNNLKASTIQGRITAISRAHQLHNFPSPTAMAVVVETWKGIRNALGTAPAQKKPLLTLDIRRIMEALPDTKAGVRDRAILLLGFASAVRRSELVGLNIEDIEQLHEGLKVTLRRSKTDQEGRGHTIGVLYGTRPETCPVRAVEWWLSVRGPEPGALFHPINRHDKIQPGRLSGRGVALIVKRAAELIGKDPDDYAGHSLRSGHVTSATQHGAGEYEIMNQTGHRRVETLRVYRREGLLFKNNSSGMLGL